MEYISRYYHRGGGGGGASSGADDAAGGGPTTTPPTAAAAAASVEASSAPAAAAKHSSPPSSSSVSHQQQQQQQHRQQSAHHGGADPADDGPESIHRTCSSEEAPSHASTARRSKDENDPFERYRRLEEELVRLKFEYAASLEEEDASALRDRRGREEAERLRARLAELKAEIRGTGRRRRLPEPDPEPQPEPDPEPERLGAEDDGGGGAGDEGGGGGAEVEVERKDDDGAERDDDGGEEEGGDDDEQPAAEAPSPSAGSPTRGFDDDDGGLRLRRDKMDTNVRRLKRDVDILREDVESVRSNAARSYADLAAARAEHDRVPGELNAMERTGENLANEVTRLQFSARQAVRNRVEVTLERETADANTSQLRGKCEALRVDIATLRERVTTFGDDARDFRADAAHNREVNARIREKILMTTDPEEYRKGKAEERRKKKLEEAEERRRKKLEGKLEGRRSKSEGGGGDGKDKKIGAWLSRSVMSVTHANHAKADDAPEPSRRRSSARRRSSIHSTGAASDGAAEEPLEWENYSEGGGDDEVEENDDGVKDGRGGPAQHELCETRSQSSLQESATFDLSAMQGGEQGQGQQPQQRQQQRRRESHRRRSSVHSSGAASDGAADELDGDRGEGFSGIFPLPWQK